MKQSNVVIIGGGPAGRVIAGGLKKIKGDALSITLIKDEEVNANRCSIAYGIVPAKPVEKYVIPNSLVTESGTELLIDTVTEIDPQHSQIHTNASGSIHYDTLVLATGARPIIPPIPGVNAQNILPLRSRDNMILLRELGQKFKKVVIVGAGYIGIEVADVLCSQGLDVTVVEKLPHSLSTTVEPDFIEEIEGYLKSKGITIITGMAATEFQSRDGRVSGVCLDNGDVIEADFVLLSVGVAPNIDLASKSGITASNAGFVTDEFLRTNIPNIYAAGDCAEKLSFITGKPIRGELGTNAVFMAKVVVANILGKNQRFPGVINANATTIFDWSVGAAGMMEAIARSEGIDVVSGSSEVLTMYPMMDGVGIMKTKLVFKRENRVLIGGTILRKDHGVIQGVDLLSLSIQMGATIEQLLRHQYATHPYLAARPSDNGIVFAAQDAMKKFSPS